MAVIRLAVTIGSISAPGGRHLDLDDLRLRVQAELAQLLEHEPLTAVPSHGATIAAPGGPVRAPSTASPASIAHSIARHVHRGLIDAPGGVR